MNPQLLVIVLVIVPVLSVCLGFTVHYAIRPLVEALLDAIHELAGIAGGSTDAARIARLESELARLDAELRELRAAPPLADPSREDAPRLSPGSDLAGSKRVPPDGVA